MQAHSVPAIFGDNYTIGDIGFQFTDNSFISQGIVYFTDWEAMSDIVVSHSFIVTDRDKCVEALGAGVVESPLIPRFSDPHVHITIRRPVGLTIQRGMAIRTKAAQLLGTPYDFSLIGGMVVANSRLIRWLPTDIYMPYRRAVCQLFHTIGKLICAGASVKSLLAVLEYVAALPEKYYVYDPQMLFENTEVFKTWKYKYAGTH